jgi:hypothetical protein
MQERSWNQELGGQAAYGAYAGFGVTARVRAKANRTYGINGPM